MPWELTGLSSDWERAKGRLVGVQIASWLMWLGVRTGFESGKECGWLVLIPDYL
jgi:hypothetical protein